MSQMNEISLSDKKFPWYVEETSLSDYELEMREFLMYDFNITLKSFLFKNAIEDRYDQYCYNCCRQTAVFGYFVLNKLFPKYSYRTFEATFTDKLFDQDMNYEHCYIIASKDDRHILIDMARTTNPLVFHPFTEKIEYPDIEEYKNMRIVESHEFFCEPLWDVDEYITGKPTYKIVDFLLKSRRFYKNIEEKEKAVNFVYSIPIIKVNEVLKTIEQK